MTPLTSNDYSSSKNIASGEQQKSSDSFNTTGTIESYRGKKPKNGMFFRVLVYLRVSVAEARTGGHTLETQEMRLAQKLNQIYGMGRWQMEVQKDDGVSGGLGIRPTRVSKKTRPGLATCATLLDTREYDAFAVYNLSRLAREVRVMEEFLKEYVQATDTDFHSATEDIDLSTSQGWLYVRILTAVNTAQREAIVERCQDAAAARIEQGYPLGDAGYGWQLEPEENVPPGGRRSILPNPEQGKWVLHIRDRFFAGWGLHRVARELNELGVPTPDSYKKHCAERPTCSIWRYGTILNIIENPVHAGLVRMPRTGDLYQGRFFEHRYYEPEVFYEIQQLRKERKERGGGTNTIKEGTNAGSLLLLNGLLTCKGCGRRLYPSIQKGNEKNARYCCQAGRIQPGKCKSCPGIAAKIAILDETVVEEIGKLAQMPLMQSLLGEEAERALEAQEEKLKEIQAHLREQMERLEGQFLQWAQMASSQKIAPEQFGRFNEKLLEDQREVRERLSEVEAQLACREQKQAQAAKVRELVSEFPLIWRHLTLEEKREVLRQMLERLALSKSPDGKTPLLTIKVHLLPERTVPVLQQPVFKKRKEATKGVAALTPRQLAFLYHIGEGKTEREAAEAMGVVYGTARRFVEMIRKALDVYDMQEAVRLAGARLHQEGHTLPLSAGKQPGNLTSGSGSRHEKAKQAGVEVYLEPELREALRLFARSAKVKDVAQILSITEAEATCQRNRIMAAVHARSMFEAVTKLQQAGITV